jgi:DNA-directed RNA polymerase specialized sigma24 family protein
VPRKDYHNYNREKKRHVPNWPEPSEKSLNLFHAHLYLADVLTQKYTRIYYFPGYGVEDIKQEILLAIYKASLYFKPEKGVTFRSYVSQGVRNRLVNIMRDQVRRIHPQNDGEQILWDLDEGEGQELVIGRPRYSRLNGDGMIYQDEKEIIGGIIGELSERDLRNLNMLCSETTGVVKIAAASGKSRSAVYK